MKHVELTNENLPFIENLAEHLPGGFVLYQENERRDILFVNHSLLKMYECETLEEFKELTGYTFNGMVHPDDFAFVQQSIDDQIGGQHGSDDHVEYRIVTKNRKIRWVDDYGHFSKSEDFGDLYYVFLIDVTEKKEAEEAESKFFFDISHEILTPMNAVSTCIALAQRHADDPALIAKYLENARMASDHMVRLFDELLNIHREKEISPEIIKPAEDYTDGKPRILIAEDNLMNQELLQIILEEAGFITEVAEDGNQAVEMVKNHETDYYNMILMDIRMPVMNGYDAVRQIRQLPQGTKENLPVYAVSANARDEDKAESMKAGMNGHLAKPYDGEQIIEVIRRYTKNDGKK